MKSCVKEWQHKTSSPMYNVNRIKNDATGKDTKESKTITWKAVCSAYNKYFKKLERSLRTDVSFKVYKNFIRSWKERKHKNYPKKKKKAKHKRQENSF